MNNHEIDFLKNKTYCEETGQYRKGELASKPLNINKIKNI